MTLKGHFFTPSIDLSEFRAEDGQLHGTLLGLSDNPKMLAALRAAGEREANVRGAALLAQAQQFSLLYVYRPGALS